MTLAARTDASGWKRSESPTDVSDVVHVVEGELPQLHGEFRVVNVYMVLFRKADLLETRA